MNIYRLIKQSNKSMRINNNISYIKHTLIVFLFLAYTGVFSLFVLHDYTPTMHDAYNINEDDIIVNYIIDINHF